MNYLAGWDYVIAAGIVLFAGLVQSATGFAFGLLAIPSLLLLGIPLPVALAVTLVGVLGQTAGSVVHLRREGTWARVWLATALRIVGMVAGTLLLRLFVSLPSAQIRFAVGVFILVFTLLRALWQPRPRERLARGWDVVAFLSSGFTAGLVGMGGPPLVLWVMAHNWSNAETRAFLLRCFLVMVPWQFAMLLWVFGHDTLAGALLGIILLPAVVAGTILGLRIGNRFSKTLLRRIAYGLLLIIALNAILPVLIQLAR